jgi:hypothetical protein
LLDRRVPVTASIDSPVTSGNDFFLGSPYAVRRALYEDIPWLPLRAEALQDRPFPDSAQQVGVAERGRQRNDAASCASESVPAGTVGSNSPWIMLCAR